MKPKRRQHTATADPLPVSRGATARVVRIDARTRGGRAGSSGGVGSPATSQQKASFMLSPDMADFDNARSIVVMLAQPRHQEIHRRSVRAEKCHDFSHFEGDHRRHVARAHRQTHRRRRAQRPASGSSTPSLDAVSDSDRSAHPSMVAAYLVDAETNYSASTASTSAAADPLTNAGPPHQVRTGAGGEPAASSADPAPSAASTAFAVVTPIPGTSVISSTLAFLGSPPTRSASPGRCAEPRRGRGPCRGRTRSSAGSACCGGT